MSFSPSEHSHGVSLATRSFNLQWIRLVLYNTKTELLWQVYTCNLMLINLMESIKLFSNLKKKIIQTIWFITELFLLLYHQELFFHVGGRCLTDVFSSCMTFKRHFTLICSLLELNNNRSFGTRVK